jgi:hypothetical protein
LKSKAELRIEEDFNSLIISAFLLSIGSLKVYSSGLSYITFGCFLPFFLSTALDFMAYSVIS